MLKLFLQGLKFPWESAVSGREVCPEEVYGHQEVHVNGDVTLAFQNYLYLTEVSWFLAPATIPASGLPANRALCCRICRCSGTAGAPSWCTAWRTTGSPGLNGTRKTRSIISWVRMLLDRVHF